MFENDLPPKSEAQSERGIQFWRQNLSANEREAAAILDSADLEYESPGKVSAQKTSITRNTNTKLDPSGGGKGGPISKL